MASDFFALNSKGIHFYSIADNCTPNYCLLINTIFTDVEKIKGQKNDMHFLLLNPLQYGKSLHKNGYRKMYS